MIFHEVGPDENLDVSRFSSVLRMPVKIARRELLGSSPPSKEMHP